MVEKKICPQCKNLFEPKLNQIYCDPKYRNKSSDERRIKRFGIDIYKHYQTVQRHIIKTNNQLKNLDKKIKNTPSMFENHSDTLKLKRQRGGLNNKLNFLKNERAQILKDVNNVE